MSAIWQKKFPIPDSTAVGVLVDLVGMKDLPGDNCLVELYYVTVRRKDGTAAIRMTKPLASYDDTGGAVVSFTIEDGGASLAVNVDTSALLAGTSYSWAATARITGVRAAEVIA